MIRAFLPILIFLPFSRFLLSHPRGNYSWLVAHRAVISNTYSSPAYLFSSLSTAYLQFVPLVYTLRLVFSFILRRRCAIGPRKGQTSPRRRGKSNVSSARNVDTLSLSGDRGVSSRCASPSRCCRSSRSRDRTRRRPPKTRGMIDGKIDGCGRTGQHKSHSLHGYPSVTEPNRQCVQCNAALRGPARPGRDALPSILAHAPHSRPLAVQCARRRG